MYLYLPCARNSKHNIKKFEIELADRSKNAFVVVVRSFMWLRHFWPYYRPQRSWGKVIFSEAYVKNSVHGGGGWLGLAHCMLGYTPQTRGRHPQEQTPPGQRQTPHEQTPPRSRHSPQEQTPPAQCILGDRGNKRVVRILLECILILIWF